MLRKMKIETKSNALPPGWRMVRLGEVIREALPGFACGKRADASGYIQLRMNNITNRGLLDLSSVLRVPATKEQVEKYQLKPGDIIFNNTNSVDLVGKTALFNVENGIFLYSNHLTRLRTIADSLEPIFLASWLQLQWYNRVFEIICNRWIGQAAVQREKLLNLNVPLPPLHEQKRIAAKLQELMQEVERARTACEKQLEAAQALPPAYLRQVFDSEESQKWEKKRLREVCKIIMGQSPPSNTYNKEKIGLPFFQGKADFGDYFPMPQIWCSSPKKIADPNDVLISVRAPVGPVNMADQRCCIGRGLTALRGKDDIDSWFLFFYFKFIENNWRGRGSTFDAIRKPDLQNISIPYLSISERKRISIELKEKMTHAANLQSATQNQLSTLNSLPQAILRKAFSGEL